MMKQILYQNTFFIKQGSATVSGSVRLVCKLCSLIPHENFRRRELLIHVAYEHRIWCTLPVTFSILHFSCHGCISDSIYKLSMNGHQIQHRLRILYRASMKKMPDIYLLHFARCFISKQNHIILRTISIAHCFILTCLHIAITIVL